jgi:hypothetical protein
MTTAVVGKNALFKPYFLKRKEEGLIPQKALLVAVGTLVAQRPPHRSRRAGLRTGLLP